MKKLILIILNLLLIIYAALYINSLAFISSNNALSLLHIMSIGIIIPLLNLYLSIKLNKNNVANFFQYYIVAIISLILLNLFLLISGWVLFTHFQNSNIKGIHNMLFIILLFIIPAHFFYFLYKVKYYKRNHIKITYRYICIVFKTPYKYICSLKEIYSMKKLILIILNLLLIITILLFLFLNNTRELLLLIFIGIIIPLLNLYILIKLNRGSLDNLLKYQKIAIFGSIFFNLYLFILSISIIIGLDKWTKADDILFAILFFTIPLLYYYTIYKKNDYKIIYLYILKFLKILKWGFVLSIVGFIILLISIYISSLNSYKESDFNIPKDFFDTKHSDKNPLSEENGFNDFTSFLEDLRIKGEYNSNVHLQYFNILSKCVFKDKRYLESFEEKKGSITYEEFCKEREENYYFKDAIFANDKNSNTEQKVKKLDKDKYKQVEIFNLVMKIKDFDKEIAILDEKILKEKNYFLKYKYIQNLKNYKIYKQIKLDNPDVFAINLKEHLNINDDNIDLYYEDLKRIEKFKEEVKRKGLRQLKNFVAVNSIKYKKINNKEYVLHTEKLSGVFDKVINFKGLLEYSRALNYVAYTYFEEGKHEKGINVLLNFQTFINNLKLKGDFNLMSNFVIISLEKNYINAINYFVDNYELNKDLKKKIIDSLKVNNYEELIDNGIKWTYKFNDRILDENNMDTHDISIKERIKLKLFYSAKESRLLNDKNFFDTITNNGTSTIFITDLNINNIAGRTTNKVLWSSYLHAYKKLEEMKELKNELINKLK